MFEGEDVSRMTACSCWWFAHLAIEFVHHDSMIRALWGEADQQQLLISPDVLLRMQRPAGDCAIFTMLICAMLRARGVRYEIVTAAVDPSQPEIYSHVYARAVMPDGTRLPLDASHGKYPGWQVPAEHRTRTQVWDESGHAIADTQPWSGLHGYVAGKRRRGVGYIDPETGQEAVFGGGSDPNVTTLQDPFGIYGQGAPTYSTSTPSGGGFNYGQFFAGISNKLVDIFGRKVAPTTYVRGPNGQYIETPGSAPSLTTAFSAASGGGNLLLWGGIGVGVILLAKAFGKK